MGDGEAVGFLVVGVRVGKSVGEPEVRNVVGALVGAEATGESDGCVDGAELVGRADGINVVGSSNHDGIVDGDEIGGGVLEGVADKKTVGAEVGSVVGDAAVRATEGEAVGSKVVSTFRRGASLGADDGLRRNVVESVDAIRSSQCVNMWQKPLMLNTNALHSGCERQAAMQSSSDDESPISLKIGALDSRLDLLQRSAVSSTSNWLSNPVVVIVVVRVVVSVVDSGCS